MKVHFVTFGCKANQYDTERFRQELAARGAVVVEDPEQADACVVNTCTVTNNADAEARRAIRRLKRRNPQVEILVAGCSAALRADEYARMGEVFGVVKGHDPLEVVEELGPLLPSLDVHEEPIGAALLERNARGTRAWMKIQDGCDRRCAFCATKLARGRSRSREESELIQEARRLAAHHPEIVLTGVHIGHYGWDRNPRGSKPHTLSKFVRLLLDEVPEVRFRLGSVEATEVDDLMVELLERSDGRLVPHLHVPMQSGADPVLRRMRRWHTREQYRSRMLSIADRLGVFGFGADIITGFPGESDEDHAVTRALVEELPLTYVHVFPFSVRDGTPAASMPDRVPGNVAAERSRELREIVAQKGLIYRASRSGQLAEVVIEDHEWGLTEDYLRVRLAGAAKERAGQRVSVPLRWTSNELVAHV
ncbi:MAG: MiaB/RimO family radical SAM methylthiotransferase [Myxococcota bacterium]